MKKVLAINSGSSSFKFKLFSLPDEKVVAFGMADRVGLPKASQDCIAKWQRTY